MTAADFSTPNARLGKYLLERRIASGGMADVFLARQLGSFGFAKTVALKVLRSEVASDSDHVRMFLREALVAAEFHHPNLVQVYEVGEEKHKLFIAMELVRGLSIASLMNALAHKGRSIPIPIAARIALDCLDGLAHAHEAHGSDGAPLRLVHRDVTPQNVLVAVDGGVKVVDFGIARAETALGRTQAHRIKGKFSYMAPEQWEPGRDIDARADLFALGVVLYEMSTGSGRLFKGAGAPELYRAVLHDPIPPPSTRVADYPPALADVVMKALERSPAARWASARAMRDALAQAMDACGWHVADASLARLVDVALDGEAIERRWEPVASADVPRIRDEDPTVVEDVGTAPPAALRPFSLPPAGELDGGARALAVLADDARVGAAQRARAAWALAALVGWLAAGATLGLYLRARAQVLVLQAAVAHAATGPAARRPAPPAPVAPLVVRADPDLAAGVGAAWAQMVEARRPGAAVRVEAGLALDALLVGDAPVALRAGVADAAAVRRAADLGVVLRSPASEHVVGYDAAVVIVHPSNRVASLTLAELAALHAGRVRSFASLGGPRGAPHVVVGPEGSAARSILQTATPARAPGSAVVVAPSDARARELVAADPRAVAVVPIAAVGAGVRVVPLARDARSAAVAPSREAVRALTYPLARAVVLYTRGAPEGAARDLVEVASGPAGQSVLERAGYVSR